MSPADRTQAGRLGQVLRTGTLLAVAVLMIGCVVVPLGASTLGAVLQRAGMMIMVATPIIGLFGLGIGFRRVGDRHYAGLVAVVLVLITVTALIGPV